MTGAIHKIGLSLLAALLAALLTLAAPAAGAKKKAAGKVDVTNVLNLPIPTATPSSGGPFFAIPGILSSTIDVGKQFKGKRVRDVNITVQTLGTSGNFPADDLRPRLTAPNGATVTLFSSLDSPPGTPNPSIGPLTLDDEARLGLGSEEAVNPGLLYAPWAGSATPSGGADTPLSVMDDGPVRGTWTLRVYDTTTSETSNLVSWRLNVVAGRPFQTK